MKFGFRLIFFLGGFLATFATSGDTQTTDYPYESTTPMMGDSLPVQMTFADRVNSLLNAKTLIPNYPEQGEEASQEQNPDTSEIGISEIISRLKKFLKDDQTLNQVYSNYLDQFCGDRVEISPSVSGRDHNRQSVFKENLLQIAEHNALAREGKISYETGINKFTDMTSEEILGSYTGAIISKGEHITNHSIIPQLSKIDLDLDESEVEGRGVKFNWVTHGGVSTVKDQGRCGSCVFFAVVAAVESAFLIRHRYELDLSEQELLDCMKGIPGYNGCQGNYPWPVFQYVEDFGLSLEEDYEYVGHAIDECSAYEHERAAYLHSWGFLEINKDEEILKKVVRHLGPIAVVISVKPDFTGYFEGVYQSDHCPAKDFNHMVLVVGYGRTGDGIDYWIVKNSWGQNWGDGGYIRMRRNYNNLCGIATFPFYAHVG